ncbi:MAG: hypothetical protein ACLFU4_07365 [Opitutales bacterium]
MGYKINWKERGVEWLYHGTVTGAELIQSNEDIYGDPRFDDLRYQLVDLTQVERFEVSESDIRKLAFFDAAAARSNPRIRLGIIAGNASGRAISDAYRGSIQNPPWEHQVFETREAAEHWLGIR